MNEVRHLFTSLPEGTRFGFDSENDPFAMLPSFGRDTSGRELCALFCWEWDKPETFRLAHKPAAVCDSFPPGIRFCTRDEMIDWLERRI